MGGGAPRSSVVYAHGEEWTRTDAHRHDEKSCRKSWTGRRGKSRKQRTDSRNPLRNDGEGRGRANRKRAEESVFQVEAVGQFRLRLVDGVLDLHRVDL